MAPLVLEGDTLGKKHQHYNRLLEEAIKSDQLLQSNDPSADYDIKNLLKIDVACKNRNLDYILEVLKSEDQLLVSKAIKRSIWLVKDLQYANIINPENLYTKLFPQMTSKAFNKLMLHIRLHLKDEKRVETFYNYIKENDKKSAYKWLQHCSVSFVEKEVAEHTDNISAVLLQRLFEKSFSIYETYTRNTYYCYQMKQTEYLVKKYPDKFLDFLESLKGKFNYRFSAKGTKVLMEKCSKRILNKFEYYAKSLNLAAFAKTFKDKEDIKDFLLKNAENKNLGWLYVCDKIHHFIKQMPKENRFDFVKKVFIDKNIFEKSEDGEEICKYESIVNRAAEPHIKRKHKNENDVYVWYKFAPFEIAFADLNKLIRAESTPLVRNSMLQVLLSCAQRNEKYVQKVLQYYHDEHINEPFKFKIQFINFFISKVDTHTLDNQTWEVLSQIFHSMEVFIESNNKVQFCIKAIIVRNALRKEPVADIIKNKFVFDTLKAIQPKLKKQKEKDVVFEYLREFITTKSNSLNLTVNAGFEEAVTLCEHLLNLIKDWGKELEDHPYALDRIKELIKIKKEKRWSRDLSSLYNIKKSWRKVMFQESISISPTEEVCVNALKHDSSLLFRNEDQVFAMYCDDNISLRHFFSKVRIYWPLTLGEDWMTKYQTRLDHPRGHKALVVELCTLLPQKGINELLKRYAPSEKKIDWNNIDQLELSLRKQIAKNIHKARPLAPVEGMLLYAKGDYLQYAVPSLNSILSQLSPTKSRLYIPMLLDAPVSIQKFGIRCAFHKLPSEELKPMLSELWISTKNHSIRTVLFIYTYEMLCKERNTLQVKYIWDLLSGFIDKLTLNDNKLIYEKLRKFFKVPDSIKPQFYMKSYTFLRSLPAKCNCESILRDMRYRSKDLLGSLDDDFVINVMLKNFNETLAKVSDIDENVCIISTFILATKDEETQIRRFDKSLAPILEKYLPQWEMVSDSEYRIKKHIMNILQTLVMKLESYTIEKKMQIPVKTFEAILYILENKMSYQKHYVLLTSWKLTTTFVKALNENQHVLTDFKLKADDNMSEEEKIDQYTEMHEIIAPEFAKMCAQHLKKDLNRFGSSIHSLYAAALNKCLHGYLRTLVTEHQLLYVKCLLQYGKERELSLVVYDIFKAERVGYYYSRPEEWKIIYEIYHIMMSNCYSDEMKMHFYELFANIAIPVLNKVQTP